MHRTLRPIALAALTTALPFSSWTSAQLSLAAPSSPAPSSALSEAGLRHGSSARLNLPAITGQSFGFDLPLHGAQLRVELAPHSDRAEGFQLLVQDASGAIRSVTPAPVSTYRGFVSGYPDSVVAASFYRGELRATVRLAPDLGLIGVEPLESYSASAGAGEYLIYDAADVLPLERKCGLEPAGLSVAGDPASESMPAPIGAGGSGPASAGSATDEAQIAFDADFEYFLKTAADPFVTQSDIEGKLNSVEAIYEPQTGVTYEITAILVRTAEPDPYSTTSPGGLLNQLENHWTSSQAGIPRDQTHLMTGRNLNEGTIGIAELNSICGNNRGYGLSESQFQGANDLTTVSLTAHELGHNWNATHCDGQPDCAIMCSIIGGCPGGVVQFGSQSVNRIVNKKNSSGSCLETPAPAPPILNGSASPSSVSAFQGGTISILGSQLGELSDVRVDGVSLPDVKWNSAYGELRIVEALFADAGTLDVEVENAAGVAGGVSIDVVPATGIALKGPALSIPGASLSYEWSAGEGNTYFFNFAFDGVTNPVGGFDVLTNANLGIVGTAGSGGTGGFFVPSAGSLGFVTIWLQVIVFGTGSGSLLGATDVISTLFL